VTNLMHTTKPNFNRRALATQAMQAAIATRAKAKLDQYGPICIYGLSETLGITVRFNNINMEGMYQRGAPPRIHLSARRPLPRRASLRQPLALRWQMSELYLGVGSPRQDAPPPSVRVHR